MTKNNADPVKTITQLRSLYDQAVRFEHQLEKTRSRTVDPLLLGVLSSSEELDLVGHARNMMAGYTSMLLPRDLATALKALPNQQIEWKFPYLVGYAKGKGYFITSADTSANGPRRNNRDSMTFNDFVGLLERLMGE